MKEIKKLLRYQEPEYYEVHLSIINCILPVKMTPMEMKVLSRFMNLKGDISQYRFGPSAKKAVMADLQLSPAGLSNYVVSLTEKGFLVKTGDITSIWPILFPEEKEQTYLFKLQNLG